MADPFELRLFFSNRLRALNPCEDNTEEVVAFALKHRDLDEDLWSCVMEQMDREENSINVRANITYFLEDLVELAKREKHWEYVRMVERDFVRIIDKAVTLDGLGIVNVNCVRYVLHVLHYDHGVFCTEENRAEHDKSIGQTWPTSTFAELEKHLDERAREARPDLIEAADDVESEPDMSWVNEPFEPAIVSQMDVDSSKTTREVADTVQKDNDKDVMMPDIHDVATPPGSRSPSLSSTPLRTPIAPTPLSPSPSPSPKQRAVDMKTQETTRNPTPAAARENGTPSAHAGSPSAPAKVFSPVDPISATNDVVAPPIQHSPSAFTPVQTEDANIFTKSYYELATERMEQDRERQRRKEDSSGFVALAGTVDDEVAQLLEIPTKGDVWIEDLIAERGVWGLMGE